MKKGEKTQTKTQAAPIPAQAKSNKPQPNTSTQNLPNKKKLVKITEISQPLLGTFVSIQKLN